jgi:protein-tyrosine phosphatase
MSRSIPVDDRRWRADRGVHGGIDEVPVPGVTGALWLAGKHFVGPDPDRALAAVGATTIVCLNQAGEFADRYPQYADWLATNRPERAVWVPIPDLHAPELEVAVALVDDLRVRLRAGERLILHCGAGIGRAGTMAAAVLIDLGSTLDEATARVAAHRPMAGPEAGAQRELLVQLAARASTAPPP